MHTAYTKVGLNAGFDHCSKNSMQNDWNCSEVFQMQNRRNYQKCVYEREQKKSNFSLQSVWGNWFLQLLDFTISIRSIKRLTFYDEYAVSVRKSCQQIYIEFFVSPFLSIWKGTPIGCSEYRKIVLWLVLKSYFSINLHIHGHNYYYCYCHIQSNFIFDWLLCKSIWTRALDSLHTAICCWWWMVYLLHKTFIWQQIFFGQIYSVFVDIMLWSMLKIAFCLFNGSFVHSFSHFISWLDCEGSWKQWRDMKCMYCEEFVWIDLNCDWEICQSSSSSNNSTVDRGKTPRPPNKTALIVRTRTFMTLNIHGKTKDSIFAKQDIKIFCVIVLFSNRHTQIFALQTALYKSILRFEWPKKKGGKRWKRRRREKNRRMNNKIILVMVR